MHWVPVLWWFHDISTFSIMLLALREENSTVTSVFPHKGPVMVSFAFYLCCRLNKLLNAVDCGLNRDTSTLLRPFCNVVSCCFVAHGGFTHHASVTSMKLEQSYIGPSTSTATLKHMGKRITRLCCEVYYQCIKLNTKISWIYYGGCCRNTYNRLLPMIFLPHGIWSPSS